MSKLVDKERLAKLAQALDARAKAAVAAEKERALAAEQAIDAKANANAAAIAAINNAETGILKQAKDYADGEVNKEKERAEEQEGLLAGRLDTLEGIIGGNAEGALGEVIADVKENAEAIAKLNGEANEEGSVKKAVADAVATEKARAEGAEQGLSQRIAATEAFVTAQPAVDKAQNDRLALLEEMMGLGGTEGNKTAIEELQDSIDAVEDKADQAQAEVDLVEERMTTAEADIDQLQADVTKLNGDENTDGSVKKQIADAIATVDQAAEALENRVAANEAFVAGYADKEKKVREDFAAADATLKTALQKEIDDDVKAEADRAKGVEGNLDTAIKAEAQAARAAEKGLADRLVVIEGEGEGSVKKALADAKSYTDGKIEEVNGAAEGLTARVKANEDALAIVQGVETVEGSIAKAEKDAKDYADQKITALVNSAPEAMNTLKELADAITAHGDEYKAYVATVSQNIATAKQEAITAAVKDAASKDATLKTALQAEIDADVKVEKERAEKEEAAIRTEFAAADTALHTTITTEISAAVKAEADRAKLEEQDIRADFADADTALQAKIDLKVAQSDYNTKVTALEKADTALGNRIAAFEANGAKDVAALMEKVSAAEKDIDNLQAFVAAQPGKDQAMEQAIAANKAAIEAEVGKEGVQGARDVAIKAAVDKEVTDRDAAIAKALEVYSTTAEMKQIIGNVVNSLALTMENDQVVLKLGGVDGIKLASVSLELATEDDINDIIAKLDA